MTEERVSEEDRWGLTPFRFRAFRLLWIGQTLSAAGTAITRIALIFAILELGGGAADIGYITAVQTVATMVFTLVGGVWADRLRRNYVMLGADVLRAVVQGTLAALLLTGNAQIWQLGLGAAIFGGATAFFDPASSGLLPETLPSKHLQSGTALINFAGSFFSVGGPAAAGLLIAVFSPGLVFAVDALSFVVSAISLALLRLAPRTLAKAEPFWRDLRTGWREVTIRPWYWTTLIAHSLWNAAMAAYFVLGPVIAADRLGGAGVWGILSACWAAGGIVGGIITLRFKPKRPLVAANLALILTIAPMLAIAPPLQPWLIGVAAFASGIGLFFLGAVWSATVGQLIPNEVRSRVESYDWMISLVAMPIGFAIVGPLAAHIGNAATLIGGAALIAIPCSLTVLIPGVRAIRRTADGTVVGPPVPQAAPADPPASTRTAPAEL
ncbi:MFS transporter [Rhizomonospora bruguierae]|uniref:MFS transporter n=1 Tax=Rhizomonospora bruguierae TaxID=1581705 RepID=UPI001BD16BAB|nr:MFS transporter [Micromonospora sp. NBRC 107566]